MLRVLLLSIPVCGAMGSLIGLMFRGRKVAQLNVAILASVAYFAILEWKLGDSTEWSWTDPIVSALYLFGPFALFFLAPTLVAAFLVGHRRPVP
jgi:hypothetical protein